MRKFKSFAIRVVALVAYEGFATFGLNQGLGIGKVQAALSAALLPLVAVLRETAKGLIDDGKLSKEEQDAAINAGKSASKSK